MKKILLCSALALLVSSPALAQEKKEYDFAGVNSCKKCHRKVWKTWKKTPMAESFTILMPGERAEMKTKAGLDPNKDYTKDASCLPCHTTGYGKAGGFVSVEETPDLKGVGCEACHGAGTAYNKVMKKRGRVYTEEEMVHTGLNLDPRATCLTCHNEKSPTSEFQEKIDPSEHDWPGHDEVKLKYHTPEYQANKL